MTWFERMNNALDYIENNLDNDIDLNEIAKIACQSVSNFQRMFSIIADIPLSVYIRRRRLTLAALELQNTNIKIIDLALKYGYDSPEAFTRAFNVIHGVAPSLAREKGIRLKAYPRIYFLLTVKGVIAMDYRLEKREAFKVYGLEDVYTFENIENEKGRSIPQVWQDLCKNKKFRGGVRKWAILVYKDVKSTLEEDRSKSYSAINLYMIKVYWSIGKLIVEAQNGEEKAEYGEFLIKNLSKELTKDFGKGFT